MKNKSDFFIGLGLLTVCLLFWQQIALLPTPLNTQVISASTFPLSMVILLGILSIILLLKSQFGAERKTATWPEKSVLQPIVVMAGLIISYIAGFIYLGEHAMQEDWPVGTSFIITTGIFLLLAQWLTLARKVTSIMLVSGLITGSLYLVFGVFFKVPLL